jgi:hypothetical protein
MAQLTISIYTVGLAFAQLLVWRPDGFVVERQAYAEDIADAGRRCAVFGRTE